MKTKENKKGISLITLVIILAAVILTGREFKVA